jgi:hypothetical protein
LALGLRRWCVAPHAPAISSLKAVLTEGEELDHLVQQIVAGGRTVDRLGIGWAACRDPEKVANNAASNAHRLPLIESHTRSAVK